MPIQLVAALACRTTGTRLYGKPLQRIDIQQDLTILEYLTLQLRRVTCIQDVVFAISEGPENHPFHQIARKLNVPTVVGGEFDVLGRLIRAADLVGAEHVFRVTTECPFIYLEGLQGIFDRHREEKADLTVIQHLPEGAYYELVRLSAFKSASREMTRQADREYCTRHIKENRGRYKVLILDPPAEIARPDIRLTVDYPEDLVVIRHVYKALAGPTRFPALIDIVRFLDAHPDLKDLVKNIEAGDGRIWL